MAFTWDDAQALGWSCNLGPQAHTRRVYKNGVFQFDIASDAPLFSTTRVVAEIEKQPFPDTITSELVFATSGETYTVPPPGPAPPPSPEDVLKSTLDSVNTIAALKTALLDYANAKR